MKKNVLVKVGERTETRERIIPTIYDENGEIVTAGTVEQYTVTVPIMEARNVDMTPDEIAEFERQQAEMPEPEPTQEERIYALETTTDDIVLMLADIIGGEESYEDTKHIEIENHGKSIQHQN